MDNFKITTSADKTYYLNTKLVTLRGNRESRIYYFSKDQRPENCPLPTGYKVIDRGTKLPILKKG